MPRRTQRNVTNVSMVVSDESEEEQPSTSSRRRSTKTQQSRAAASQAAKPANFDSCLVDTVKLIIQYGSTGLPFKRADLVKHALNGDQKHFTVVFEEACNELRKIYGLQVNEVQGRGGIQFYISNTTPVYHDHEYRLQQKRESILLFIILAYIYMKNGQVADTSLKIFLEKLGIDCEELDENFGAVQSLITDKFVKQHYLTIAKVEVEGTRGERNVLDWGQRAEKEFHKKEVLNAVARLLKRQPVTFIAQYQQAYGDLNIDQIEGLMQVQTEAATQQQGNRGDDGPRPSTSRDETMEVDVSSEDSDSE